MWLNMQFYVSFKILLKDCNDWGIREDGKPLNIPKDPIEIDFTPHFRFVIFFFLVVRWMWLNMQFYNKAKFGFKILLKDCNDWGIREDGKPNISKDLSSDEANYIWKQHV